MKEIKITEIRENLVKMVSEDWMLVTAGTIDDFNTMTASWGFFGEMWYMDMAIAAVRQERYTKPFIDKAQRFTLTFFNPEDKRFKDIMTVMGTKSGREIDKMHYPGLIAESLPTGQVTFDGARVVVECDVVCQTTVEQDAFKESYPDMWEKSYGKERGGLHELYFGRIARVWIADPKVTTD